MTERFLLFFSYVDKNLGGAGVFLISVAVIFILAVVAVLLAIFKSNFDLKKRSWFFLCSLAVILFEYALSFYIENSQGFTFFSAAVFLVFSIPVISIKKKDNAKAKELVRLLDQKILKANDMPKAFDEVEEPIDEVEEQKQVIKPNKSTAINLAKKEKVAGAELDFTHVKNVMARLDYYGLSPSEKKLVENLKESIVAAENYKLDQNTKSKINDGLGALLKIMSKYGI